MKPATVSNVVGRGDGQDGTRPVRGPRRPAGGTHASGYAALTPWRSIARPSIVRVVACPFEWPRARTSETRRRFPPSTRSIGSTANIFRRIGRGRAETNAAGRRRCSVLAPGYKYARANCRYGRWYPGPHLLGPRTHRTPAESTVSLPLSRGGAARFENSR